MGGTAKTAIKFEGYGVDGVCEVCVGPIGWSQ